MIRKNKEAEGMDYDSRTQPRWSFRERLKATWFQYSLLKSNF